MVVDGILGKESVEFFFLLDFRGLKGATKTRKATQQQHNEDRFIEEAVIIMVPG